jgi:hypothetical protein
MASFLAGKVQNILPRGIKFGSEFSAHSPFLLALHNVSSQAESVRSVFSELDGNAQPPNAGFSAAFIGFHGDASTVVHRIKLRPRIVRVKFHGSINEHKVHQSLRQAQGKPYSRAEEGARS